MRSRSLSTSVVILWNLWQPALWWTIPAIEAIERSEPTVKRFKAMQVKDGIRRTSLSLLLNSTVKWPTSFITYGQTPEIGNFPLIARCKICSQRVVGGGGIDHVSWKIKWPFHISRTINSAFHVSREKKTFLYDQFFLLWLRTTAKELPCSMSSPFSRFLFLVLWKGNRVLCLEVEAPHHLLIQKHCHPRSRYRIQRAGLLWKFQMKIHLFFHHLVAPHCHSSRWIQHSKLVSQIIVIKIHGSRRLSIQFMGNKTSNSRFTKIPITALFPLDVFISIERVDTYWCWQRTMQPCLLFSRNCTKKAKNLS